MDSIIYIIALNIFIDINILMELNDKNGNAFYWHTTQTFQFHIYLLGMWGQFID